jgi:hypothetical protein
VDILAADLVERASNPLDARTRCVFTGAAALGFWRQIAPVFRVELTSSRHGFLDPPRSRPSLRSPSTTSVRTIREMGDEARFPRTGSAIS